jgi:purine-binding chemotaxis protein CheW
MSTPSSPSRSLSHAEAPLIATDPAKQQLLCFHIGEQVFGIDILRVQEIRRMSPITALPDVPAHVLGVINVRGSVIPVIDLRLRFNAATAEFDRLTAIIIVAVGDQSVGIVVDQVTRVVHLREGGVRPPPALSATLDHALVVGLVPDGDRLVTWLDVERLLRGEISP